MPFPSKRSPELEAEVLRRLSSGEPLAQICRSEGMPHPTTWNDWCAADEALGIAHARARDEGFDAIAADCLGISDDGSADWIERKREDGSTYEALNAEHISRSKLRVETRLKLLAKWDPKRYGDKLQVESKNRTAVAALPDDPVAAARAYEELMKGD